jgi:hypothetical protein
MHGSVASVWFSVEKMELEKFTFFHFQNLILEKNREDWFSV